MPARLKIKKKTRKKIMKRVRKLFDRYGPEAVTAIVTAAGAAVAARLDADGAGPPKKKAKGFSPSAVTFP